MSVIVFTAILGGSDSLKPAPVGADLCVCFTDAVNDAGERSAVSSGWDLMGWPATHNPRREAWRLRCRPHSFLPPHSTSVWVDASFTLTDLPRLLKDAEGHDISGLRHHKRSSCYEEGREIIRVGQADPSAVNAQLDSYRRAGFAPSQLTISCVLVRTNTAKVNRFNELWAAEIIRHDGDNTQLSLDYCAWQAGLAVHALEGGRKDNPYAVHDHADHKRRRKPYR